MGSEAGLGAGSARRSGRGGRKRRESPATPSWRSDSSRRTPAKIPGGRGEGLAEYVAEDDPFPWDDVGLADPAVWIGFKRALDGRFRSTESSGAESLAFVRDCLEGQGAHCTRSFPDEDETPFTESLDRAADLSERSGMLDDPGRRDWGRVRRRTERTSSLGCDDRRRAAALKFRPLSPVP